MKLNWNWDLLDTLRTVLLTLSIMANLYLVKLIRQQRNEFRQVNADLLFQRAARMKHNDESDSITHQMLRTIIKGQITTHDIQTYQLKTIDSLTKK